MNPDALSDLVLLLVCCHPVVSSAPAACCGSGCRPDRFGGLPGVLRYSGLEPRCWGHTVSPACWPPVLRFPLLCIRPALAGCAAGHVARRSGVCAGRGGRRHRADAGRSGALVAGGAGRVCAGDCLDGGAAAQYRGLAGTLALLGSFVVAATGKADSNYLGLFNTVQLMHYTLALALALLAVGPRAPQTSTRPPECSGGARLAQGFPFGDLGCGQQALHHITDHDDTTDRRF